MKAVLERTKGIVMKITIPRTILSEETIQALQKSRESALKINLQFESMRKTLQKLAENLVLDIKPLTLDFHSPTLWHEVSQIEPAEQHCRDCNCFSPKYEPGDGLYV